MPTPTSVEGHINSEHDDPADVALTMITLIGEPITLTATATFHYRHLAKNIPPFDRKALKWMVFLWVVTMTLQVMLWALWMCTLPNNGVLVTDWLSTASEHRIHLSLAILAFPYHTCVLIWGVCCNRSDRDPDGEDNDDGSDNGVVTSNPAFVLNADLDSDNGEQDDADDVPLIAYESNEGGVSTFNPSFDLNADSDSDNDEHDDAESITDAVPLVAQESNEGGVVTSNPSLDLNADLDSDDHLDDE